MVDLGESFRQEVRGKVRQGTRVGQNSSGEINRLDKILGNGHYVTNVRDDIWVIATIRQDAIITKKLAILLETVRIVASLVI